MSDIAIKVKNLSKRYRIGLKEEMHDTLAGALTDLVTRPVRNLRRLRRLTRFDDRGPETGDGNPVTGPPSPVPPDIIWALKGVSFEVKRGEVVGIIGRNGAGKSTLLKILSRITHPTSGRVEIYGRVSSLLEVGTGFHPELTGRENIYLNGTILGMTKAEIDKKFDEIVDFSGVEKFIDTPVKRYSSGMRVRLAFSVAAHLEPEILLVDEVLAVGDAAFQKKCLGKMEDVAKAGRTVLFVSHNMEAILNLCPTCLLINNGRNAYYGRSEDVIRFYLSSFTSQISQLDSHILYDGEHNDFSKQAKILRIEILDSSCQPKHSVYTWDDLVFRVHYTSYREYQRGHIVLDIYDYKLQRLIVFDSGSQLSIEEGSHYVDCFVNRLPLAAGEYYIGAGIALERTQWLWREENVALLHVFGKDVFKLGRPPVISRMLFVVEHKWCKW